MSDRIKVLYPSRLKNILLFLGSTSFVIIGLFILKKEPVIGWIGIVFFGLCLIVSIIELIPGSSHLKLTRDGFEMRHLFRSYHTPWVDVKGFRVGYITTRYMRKKMVMFDLSENCTKYKTGRKLVRLLRGRVEACLADTYGMSAEKLAALMNEWKSRSK